MSARARWAWVVGAAVVVAAVVFAVWRGSAAPLGEAAPPTGSASSSVAPTPKATQPQTPSSSATSSKPPKAGSKPKPTGTKPSRPAEPPAAPLDEEVVPVRAVTASVDHIERVAGKGSGPGEIDGPAVRFRLTIENSTRSELSLVGAVVNAYFGADETPGIQLSQPGGKPFPEAIKAGGSASGTFVFLLPDDEPPLTVELFLSGLMDPVRWSGATPR